MGGDDSTDGGDMENMNKRSESGMLILLYGFMLVTSVV